MIYLFRKTVFNCHEATLLSIKKEEGRITLFERVKLAYHLMYCNPCHNFITHWNILGKKGRETAARYLHRPPFTLAADSRNRIQKQVDLQKT